MIDVAQLAAPAEPEAATTPACPHFGACGGCQLQHLAYQAQLDRKAELLHTLLSAATPELPEIERHASPPFGYRNRIRLTLARDVGPEAAGVFRAGYLSADDALTFLPITQCPIAAPILWRAAECFLAIADRAGWLHAPSLQPDQLELFTSADESRLNLTLYLRTNAHDLPPRLASAFTTLCETLKFQMPELTGAGIALLPPASPTRSRRSEVPRPGPTWGQPGLNYLVPQPADAWPGELTYWVPRTAFFQINRFLLPDLIRTVARAAYDAPNADLAWDLYAGAGLFTRALARSFERLTAVEIAEPAFTALSQTKLPNLTAVKATTLDFLRGAQVQRERPDLILVDPPRTGAGAEVCTLLGRIAAPCVIYISCAPHHLAEDLRTLIGAGYSLSALHLFDLFPQTTHIETVAILTR